MNERYRLVRPLASGGMAELFLGIARGAEGFEKPVAIKRILPYLAKDEAVASMFVAEARLATHLQHQNLVSVYDVGNDATGLFLVMELVNGWDLGVLVRHLKRRNARLPPHLVAFIGAQALAGLSHAYRRTHNGRPVLTAHRDISPSNILISREGEVKLTDFGIAKLEGVSHGTQPGVFKGKPSYAAPEVITGGAATAASDQFSLGIVLYELLAGQHPFSTSTEAIIVAMAIASGTPPPLTEVPAPLAEVVMRSLEKAPEARFPQPEAMAEALGRYLARAGEPGSSHTLAAFLAQQNLPLTLLEQAQAAKASEPARAPAAAPQAVAAPPSPPPSPPAPETGRRVPEPTSEWALPAGSSELSSSGRLVSPAPIPGPVPRTPTPGLAPTLLKSPSQPSLKTMPPPQAPAEAPAAPPTDFRCVRCGSPLPSAYAPCDACASELTMPGNAPLLASPSVLETPAERLELETREAREETFWEHKPSRPWGRWALRLAVVAGLGAGGFFAWPHVQRLLPSAERAMRGALSEPSKPPPLVINSEPSGARVVLGGEDKGTTPLLMDNNYPPGEEITVELTLKGYKPWKSTFPGNAPAQFDVELRKQR
ncbi:serine/threonine-protein kinase [Hyalangium minutum]|uniref:Putative serine/threonine protein kinase n=1 Tax=Hyalangium minutum TaxID=394096 RepID=A0A085VWH4_9BACT|nr:serine/threonine-protein kinase [Hyalangium minutum]KFE59787.1 putative serine/threonine protein kinase [Hyalangium minutum]